MHDRFQVMDIFILVDQLIDIRREFSTSYMTFPSLYSPFWWISSSAFVVSLAPHTWPFQVCILHFGDQFIDSRREFSTQCMTFSKSWILPFWWDISSTFVVSQLTYYMTFPSYGYYHSGGTSHWHSSWVSLLTTWPFHVIITSILMGHLIDIRRDLAHPLHHLSTSLIHPFWCDISSTFVVT